MKMLVVTINSIKNYTHYHFFLYQSQNLSIYTFILLAIKCFTKVKLSYNEFMLYCLIIE